MNIETVDWDAVGAIAQILGSLATLGAVWVALKLAREERSLRLRVHAKFMVLVNELGSTDLVMVAVENVGLRSARIESLFWQTGYPRALFPLPHFLALKGCMQNQDYEWVINEPMPWVIEPGMAKATYFRHEQFLAEFEKSTENDLFRKLPFSKRFRLLHFRVGVSVTTLPIVATGTVGNSLRAELENRYELNRN